MGSNVGTTLTAWILGFSGLTTDNIFLIMLKPENFSPVLALVGVCLIMAAKELRLKDIGFALVGFAILMHGMEMMSDSLSPLAREPEFIKVLTAFNNPFFGVLIGMIFTAVIQSSAASVGVLQALSLTGHITYGIAVPIIMGQNIGTCITALLSTIGVSKNAKRVSVIHVSFNLIGTIIGLALYLFLDWGMVLPIFAATISPFAIAAFHSIFNIGTTLVLLPFYGQLVRIAEHVIKDDGMDAAFLDKRLLLSPTLAAAECRKKSALILRAATEGYQNAMSLLQNYDVKLRDEIKESEETVDDMVQKCNDFLIRLSSMEVTNAESKMIADMLHCLGDMERISDYSLNLSTIIKKINNNSTCQNDKLLEDLSPINEELSKLCTLICEAYEKSDNMLADFVIDRTGKLTSQIKKIKKADLKMLKKGKEAAENSVYLSDYLTVSRLVAEHIENIADSLI